MATTITAQQQRVALVDLKTGLITKEWLRFLNDGNDLLAADVAALTTAIESANTLITALQAAMVALTARVTSLEAAMAALPDAQEALDRIFLTPHIADGAMQIDYAQLAMFMQSRMPQPPDHNPADAQHILANRMFGG